MPRGFPPQPVYPVGIDSDYTLYTVYNTTETVLASDNQPWEEEIEVKPVPPGSLEVWADNGFANVEGELLYYDAVDKTDGRVSKLKRCARNLGGRPTRYNAAGTKIRSFVIAEHHNQVVGALLNVEEFVGINFDTRVETLDYRVRHLRDTPAIWDDFSCPDVTLNFDVVDDNPATGILASYTVEIAGSFNSYRLDFGDGEFTTSLHSGTHRYSPNAAIDPVVTVGNDKCQVVQTQIERTTLEEPAPSANPPPLSIPIPDFPAPPAVTVPAQGPIAPVIEFPPIVFPCVNLTPFPGINISIGPIDIQVPSVISFTPLNIPNVISFSPLTLPSLVTITPIDVPSVIEFGPSPAFSPIGFGPAPVISPIGFGPPPTISPIDIDIVVTIDGSGIPSCISMCSMPTMVGVDWGTPPTLNVAFVHQLGQQKASKYTPEDLRMMRELGDDYRDFFPDADAFRVEYSSIGVPSEIRILPPEFPQIRVSHDLPQEIKIVAGDFDLNGTIKIVQPDAPIPSEIHVVNKDVPRSIELVTTVPSVIRVEHDLPTRIVVEGLSRIPDTIRLDASDVPDQIRVVGIPETIRLVGPGEIRLTVDEDLEVPLVYRGPPIEVKLDVPKQWLDHDEGDGYPRVKIVPAPCPNR